MTKEIYVPTEAERVEVDNLCAVVARKPDRRAYMIQVARETHAAITFSRALFVAGRTPFVA